MSWQSCALLWSSGGSPTRWLCLQKICRECGIQKQNASERFNNKLYGTKLLALEFHVKYQVQVMGVKGTSKPSINPGRFHWHCPGTGLPAWVLQDWMGSQSKNSPWEEKAVSDRKIFNKKLRPEWTQWFWLDPGGGSLFFFFNCLQPKKGKMKRTNGEVRKPGERRLAIPSHVSVLGLAPPQSHQDFRFVCKAH